MRIELAGYVETIVDDQIIIKASQPGTSRVLDDGTILVFEDRSILGRIFETFGPVAAPLHSIRFNSPKEIDKEKISIGKKVYFVPDYSVWTITEQLARLKGCDASNIYDEEIDPEVFLIHFFISKLPKGLKKSLTYTSMFRYISGFGIFG